MAEQKETRDQKARRELKEKMYGQQLAMANKKRDYIKNILNGRYYLARCNMMAEQLLPGAVIKEVIDGCQKTREYMLAEYGLMKMQGIESMRNAHFAKQDLLKEFNMTEEEIVALEDDYYNGKIIREDYDDTYKRGNKAEFVNSPEDKKS